MLTSSVEEMVPNAMPSAPSTNCAAKPIRTKGSKTAGSDSTSAKIAWVLRGRRGILCPKLYYAQAGLRPNAGIHGRGDLHAW
jgi:hypothetical protein